MKVLSSLIFSILGWKIVGFDVGSLKKCLLVVVPHTSNWDFPLGLLVRAQMETKIKFVGKSELFKGPKGMLARWFGGIPVIRGVKTSFVEDVAMMFNKTDELRICIAPEGTRMRVQSLKTGFYRIAHIATVPIILIKWNWKDKLIEVAEPFLVSDDKAMEMKKIEDYFRGVIGKIPEYSFL